MKKALLTFSIFLTTLILSINSYSQNALSLDGANDYVNCGNSTSLNITGTALTLEAWIYPTSWKTQVWQGNIISKEGTGTGYMLRAGANGTLNMNIGNGPGTNSWHELSSSTGTLSLNTWQHVAGTYDGAFMRIYVNGVLIDSLAKTISMTGTASVSLYLGESPSYSGRYFPGKIDEVRIWNIAKTKAEIITNMNNELCTLSSNLKAYYTFNQGIAGGANSTITTLTDLSGNSNTGTLINFSLSGATSNWTTGQNLVPGVVTSTNSVTTCGSYTMPDGRVITTAGTYYDTLSTSGACDSLVAYSISFSSAHIANSYTSAACLSYTMPNGNLISTSGVYYDTISASGSCDTLNEYTITISAGVDDSVYQSGNKLISFDTWAPAHQWVDCNAGFTPITGQITKTYTPTTTGSYAVIVTRGSCVDTSDCISVVINNTGINLLDISNEFEVYPNPTKDILNFENFENQNITSIAIMDVTGKYVILKFGKLDNSINIESLNSGVYFIKISTEKGLATLKFIKE